MYICLCNTVTESDLELIIDTHPNITFADLQERCVGDNCFKCHDQIRSILDKRKLDNLLNSFD